MKTPTDELIKMFDRQIAELRATIAEKDKEIDRLEAGQCVLRQRADVYYDLYEFHKAQTTVEELRYKLSEMIIVKATCLACSPEVKKAYKELEAELAELRERMKPVEEVYENYNHGKGLYCDMQVIFDLWQAIKAACEGE